MAAELKRFLEKLETRGVGKDALFINAIHNLVQAYIDVVGNAAEKSIGKTDEIGLDLSKIPYDADATDDTLLEFIARLDVPIRLSLAVAAEVGRCEGNKDWTPHPTISIRDLYRNYYNGELIVRNIGPKSELVLGKELVAGIDGKLLPESDPGFKGVLRRLTERRDQAMGWSKRPNLW